MTGIPVILIEVGKWVMSGRCGVRDLEFYESFNQEYSPADWCRNPKANDRYKTFAQDGVGGQYVLCVERESDAGIPIAKLGRDGEALVIARDPVEFAWLIASGIEPISIEQSARSRARLAPSDEMKAWVKTLDPGRTFDDALETLKAASLAHADFEAEVRALAPG